MSLLVLRLAPRRQLLGRRWSHIDAAAVSAVPVERIRNFCIIAHVDHGKSTLADRLLELTGNVSAGQTQVLDSLQVERERGITVKAQAATMIHPGPEDQPFMFNLIDTPGHVDFYHEVKRSLGACQGALLLVDSTQGVQAQTLANYRIAQEANLTVLPVLTKLDLPHSDPAMALDQLKASFGIEEDDVLWTSAKTGEGVDSLLPALIERVPPPPGAADGPLRAVVVDSWHNSYQGVVCLVQVESGSLAAGQPFAVGSSAQRFTVGEVGVHTPGVLPIDALRAGQVGYILAGVKSTADMVIGDVLLDLNADRSALPPRLKVKAMLYSSVYPMDAGEFDNLRRALNRLVLNDPSVSSAQESSGALGQGFRCGFLGKLHMEVFFQRLSNEFGTDVISTAPMVPVTARLSKDNTEVTVNKPSELPASSLVKHYLEPMARVTVVTPPEYIGEIMEELTDRRGVQKELSYLDNSRVILDFQVPWQEVVVDLYDRVKSISSGYASFDHEKAEPQIADVVRVDLLLNGSAVDALSFICHRSVAERRGRDVALRLKEKIDRQQYEVVIQAAIGLKVVARERIRAFRKDVLIKGGKTVGGGDKTRKQKLLQKQKKGKARMKMVGNVELSQSAFMSIVNQK
eukprot:TRINITY_DN11979_c0_g1_i1.p1 TRINITY_DN11979_c0_g1~~TRINITY_DN11979_c0_g1_i1.p1  ORF type:complete len:630 (-),score=145.73 TRINITY_DN11979_c0_g1_i1:244-2133(-)